MTDNPRIDTDATASDRPTLAMAWKIGVTVFCRLVLNTARRFAYPFAPVLSRELGVPLTAITSLIAVNQATGILSVFSGPLADRFGYRLIMLFGLAFLVLGMFAGGLLPFYGVVMAAMFLAGLGKSVFDPALQAYVAKRVPFERRGTVIGILEISWAASTLVGIPLIGLLIERVGWRAPFFALGGAGLLGFLALRIWIPKDDRQSDIYQAPIGVFQAWRRLAQNPAARAALFYSFFVSAANDNLFVVYGAWLEEAHGLGVVALGVGTSVIGAAELVGEFLTAGLADRLGLKRSVFIGLALTTINYALLPFIGQSLTAVIVGLFIVFLAFEFTIVASLSLSTELAPEARATMMASFLASAGIGRVFGALIGGGIWLAGGIAAIGLVSAAINGLGLVALVWGLRGWRRT